MKWQKVMPISLASGFNISPDNNLFVFGEDTVSRRQYNMKVKDLKTGKIFDQGIKHLLQLRVGKW